MMYLLLFSFLFRGDPSIQLLEGTDIFQPLDVRRTCLVSESLFLLDLQEGRVLIYKNQSLQVIASKGEGPGELQHPGSLFARNGLLMVRDRQKLHMFNAQGHFQESIRFPSDLTSCMPVADGYAGLYGLLYGQEKQPLQLYSFKQWDGPRQNLMTWDSEKERNRHQPHKSGMINPTLDITMLRGDSRGDHLYVKPSGLAEVKVVDTKENLVVKVIKVEGPRIPFDREAGERWVKEFTEMHGVPLKGEYYEFYPLLKLIWVTPEDHLIIGKWTNELSGVSPDGTFYEQGTYQFHDARGNPIEPGPLDLNFHRVAAVDGNRVYVTVYNPALDEHTLALCERDQLAHVLKNYPKP